MCSQDFSYYQYWRESRGRIHKREEKLESGSKQAFLLGLQSKVDIPLCLKQELLQSHKTSAQQFLNEPIIELAELTERASEEIKDQFALDCNSKVHSWTGLPSQEDPSFHKGNALKLSRIVDLITKER